MRAAALLFLLTISSAWADPRPEGKPGVGYVPWGFYAFCEAYPSECEPVEPGILTSDSIPLLARVNREVNAAIKFRREDDRAGFDTWTLSPSEGDCDDYAITKRQRLIEAGVPRGAMRIAFVSHVAWNNHIFLVVSTTQGDVVLDNNSDELYPLEAAKILRFSVQDSSNPRIWWQMF